MLASFLPTALLCFSLLGLGSLVGGLCYWLVMCGNEMVQVLFGVFSFLAAAFLVLFAFFLQIPFILVVVLLSILVTALLCIGPAFLEGSLDDNRSKWSGYFVALAVTTYSSLAIGVLLIIFGESLLENLCVLITGSPVAGDASLLALAAGFVLTPSSISLLRWIWHTSKLRPGYDRPLECGESDVEVS